VFAVCSGGLHPGHVPTLVKYLGKNIIIQMGGGIHGNKLGTKIGAIAARQSVDAAVKKISLHNYAKKHLELKFTLDQWPSRRE
jgi:ribulose-bisphosphate carboxylase large chain